ncbi:MAG: hypothetical protein Q4B15_08615, partial [Lachnospiraceae bacterium]|nr:hypothetical protein [Lachnospiraceae bacterium]
KYEEDESDEYEDEEYESDEYEEENNEDSYEDLEDDEPLSIEELEKLMDEDDLVNDPEERIRRREEGRDARISRGSRKKAEKRTSFGDRFRSAVSGLRGKAAAEESKEEEAVETFDAFREGEDLPIRTNRRRRRPGAQSASTGRRTQNVSEDADLYDDLEDDDLDEIIERERLKKEREERKAKREQQKRVREIPDQFDFDDVSIDEDLVYEDVDF